MTRVQCTVILKHWGQRIMIADYCRCILLKGSCWPSKYADWYRHCDCSLYTVHKLFNVYSIFLAWDRDKLFIITALYVLHCIQAIYLMILLDSRLYITWSCMIPGYISHDLVCFQAIAQLNKLLHSTYDNPDLFCQLGHFHLLLEDYDKGMYLIIYDWFKLINWLLYMIYCHSQHLDSIWCLFLKKLCQ